MAGVLSSAASPSPHQACVRTLATQLQPALHWFHRERRWIDQQHLELCRIPAPTFLEQRRAEWFAARLRELDWDARLDRAGNVIATLGSSSPKVALAAHLDTVLAPRSPADISVDGDGTLRGPGVADNGAGLAAVLALARLLREFPDLKESFRPLILVATVGEEGEGNLNGMRSFVAHPPGRHIHNYIVLDGPRLDHITCQALESRRLEVCFSGPGGHSWSDFGAANPVHALAHAISAFAAAASQLAADAPHRLSFNFGLIEGGATVNAIPASARAKVDLRSENPESIHRLIDLLHQAVSDAESVENRRASGPKLSARIREIGSRPGGTLPPSSPLLSLVQAVDRHLGIASKPDCASTDANIPLSLSLPAISIGAGGQGGNAHTTAEWFHPQGRHLGLQRILLLLAALLQPTG